MSNKHYKTELKAGNMLYPLPAVMVSCGSKAEDYNIITIAWTGTACSQPPMVYISVRESRHSYNIIKREGEFIINLTTPKLAKITDWNGVKSGRDFRKFEECGLTALEATKVKCPMIAESPLNIECKLKELIKLGSHDMFLAEVVAVHADSHLIDPESGALDLTRDSMLVYAHGSYYELGQWIGKFGFSVMKPKTKKRLAKQRKNK